MDFFDCAKEIETQGIIYYSDMAQKTPITELAGIFNYLVQQEKQHYKIFDSMQNQIKPPPFDGFDIVEKSRDVFRALSQKYSSLGSLAYHYNIIYEQAQTIETKSISLYQDALEHTSNDEQKSILAFIIDQEKKHLELINSLMELQRHPGEWLENAEVNHLDEY
jgi:rubrerythrin